MPGSCPESSENMIYGTGVDIINTERLEAMRGDYGDPFFKKTFSEKEYETGTGSADPIAFFTGRFAAKEAVFKALRISSSAFRFSDIETLNDDSGWPYVVLYGHTKDHYDEIGIERLHISLSGDSGYVVAFVICEK